jgi:hypothetical protein
VLAACLGLLATFAAPAAAGGPTPDPGPGQQRTLRPDPTPQAATTSKAVVTITQPASTTRAPALPTSTSVPAAHTQPVVAPRHRHASRAVGTGPRTTHHGSLRPLATTAGQAARALRALTYDRLVGDVRASASSLNEGLLILGATILLLIVLGEVGFLAASVRLMRRAI